MPVFEHTRRDGRLWPWALGGALFVLLMLRACAFGAVYWPQLDDYIQYHNYPTSGSFSQLQQSVGLLASRPLAGIADYFVWGQMFDDLIIGVAVISLLYAASAVLFQKLLSRYFETSPVFLVVMALLPLGVEGTYWMSASTRIACGMFCAALAACAFARWMDRGGWGWAVLYGVLQVLPFGFYEQAGILGVTFTVGMAILEWLGRREHRRRGLLSLWSVPAMGLYLTITGLFAQGGVYADRAKIFLPTDGRASYYWKVFFPEVWEQVSSAFLEGGFYTLAKGFVRGARMIFSGDLLVWAVLLAIVCGLFFLAALGWGQGRDRGPRKKLWPGVLSGLILAAAPVSLFFVLENPWFSLRGAVTSFVGLALLADTLVLALWRYLPFRRQGPAALAAVLAFVFCVAGASEIRDYRDTYRSDQKIAGLTLSVLEEDFPTAESAQGVRVGILGLEPSFLPNQNFFWHEHIHGCTESSWAFSGLLNSLAEGRALPEVVPLPSDPVYRLWNQSVNRPEGFDVLYYYTGSEIVPVNLIQTGAHDFQVVDLDGGLLGVIWEEEDGLGYFRRADQIQP